jgi:hypothetical protein
MPTIHTAQDAVDVAERFVARYYTWRTLRRVSRSGKNWIVVFDVGVLSDKIVRVTLSPSGKVLGFRGIR